MIYPKPYICPTPGGHRMMINGDLLPDVKAKFRASDIKFRVERPMWFSLRGAPEVEIRSIEIRGGTNRTLANMFNVPILTDGGRVVRPQPM